MENEEAQLMSDLKDKIFQVFSEFMTRVAKFEELGAVGSRLLVGFQQGLEFLRRPPINKTSELVERIIKANETKRVLSYVEVGCVNTHDSVENINKSKCVLNELECLVEDVSGAMKTASESSSHSRHKDVGHELDPLATTSDKEEMVSSDTQKLEVTDYAAMMAILYSMVKQDYTMQEKIVSSLNLKSSSEELECYCMMWSLRPFVNDEIMYQAWKLIP